MNQQYIVLSPVHSMKNNENIKGSNGVVRHSDRDEIGKTYNSVC